jgi:hypothetical protein
MPVLMATCPRCRAEADTGLAASNITVRELARQRVLILCDGCREYQKRMVKDLYFAEEAA